MLVKGATGAKELIPYLKDSNASQPTERRKLQNHGSSTGRTCVFFMSSPCHLVLDAMTEIHLE